MRKHILCMALLFGVVGCGNATQSTENQTNNQTNNATEETMEVAYDFEWDKDIIIPEISPDAPLADAEICAFSQKYYRNFYPAYAMNGGTFGFQFYVVSNEPLTDEIEVTIDMKGNYSYTVMDTNGEEGYYLNKNEQFFPEDLYLCYRGLEWEQWRKLENAVKETSKLYEQVKAEEEEKEEPDEEKIQKYKEEFEAVNQIRHDQKTNHYNAYYGYLEETKEKRPQIHVYHVLVSMNVKESIEQGVTGSETVTDVTVQVGQWSQQVNIGEVIMHYENPYEKDVFQYTGLLWGVPEINNDTTLPTGSFLAPQTGRFVDTTKAVMAKENLNLKNIYIWDDKNSVIEEAIVNISVDGQCQSTKWKIGQDMLIRQGELFNVEVYMTLDKELLQYDECDYFLVVEYEVAGETDYILYNCRINRKMKSSGSEFWWTYAEQVHGIDVESYRQNYLYPYWEDRWNVVYGEEQ